MYSCTCRPYLSWALWGPLPSTSVSEEGLVQWAALGAALWCGGTPVWLALFFTAPGFVQWGAGAVPVP